MTDFFCKQKNRLQSYGVHCLSKFLFPQPVTRRFFRTLGPRPLRTYPARLLFSAEIHTPQLDSYSKYLVSYSIFQPVYRLCTWGMEAQPVCSRLRRCRRESDCSRKIFYPVLILFLANDRCRLPVDKGCRYLCCFHWKSEAVFSPFNPPGQGVVGAQG